MLDFFLSLSEFCRQSAIFLCQLLLFFIQLFILIPLIFNQDVIINLKQKISRFHEILLIEYFIKQNTLASLKFKVKHLKKTSVTCETMGTYSSVSRLDRIIYIDQCLEIRKAEGTRLVGMDD